jgi:hypothetical protein
LDAEGTQLADEGFDLPNMQTFSFADQQDFTDLHGDDELVATHGSNNRVKWTLEAGGISLSCWAVFTGGQIIESGATPNRTITLRKTAEDQRPYFRVNGLIMSDSGGDVEGVVYRAKCNGDINGSFGDGKFFVTAADGIGLPMPGTKLLWDLIQHESKTALSTTPKANPIMPPVHIVVTALGSTTADIAWDSVSGVTGYKIEKSNDDGDTWSSAGNDVTSPAASLTALTADTDYLFRVSSKVGTTYGYTSPPLAFHTLAS